MFYLLILSLFKDCRLAKWIFHLHASNYSHIRIYLNIRVYWPIWDAAYVYTGAAYTPISKTFSLIFGGCGLHTGNYGNEQNCYCVMHATRKSLLRGWFSQLRDSRKTNLNASRFHIGMETDCLIGQVVWYNGPTGNFGSRQEEIIARSNRLSKTMHACTNMSHLQPIHD